MLKKTDKDDHDGKSRYISNIVTLTRQQLEIIKLKDNYDEIMTWFDAIHQDEKAIMKHNVRYMKKPTQQAKEKMEKEIASEIEEEKSVRIQAKKMKGSHEMRL